MTCPLFAPGGRIEAYGEQDYYDAVMGLADDQGLIGFQCFGLNRSIAVADTNGLYIRPESRREGLGVALQARALLLCHERYHMHAFKGVAAHGSNGVKVLEKTFEGITPFRYSAYYTLFSDMLVWWWSLRAEQEMIRAKTLWRKLRARLDKAS